MAKNQVNFYVVPVSNLKKLYPYFYISEFISIAPSDVKELSKVDKQNIERKYLLKQIYKDYKLRIIVENESRVWLGDDEKTDLSFQFNENGFQKGICNSVFFRVDENATQKELSSYFALFSHFDLFLMSFPNPENDYSAKVFQPSYKKIKQFTEKHKNY